MQQTRSPPDVAANVEQRGTAGPRPWSYARQFVQVLSRRRDEALGRTTRFRTLLLWLALAGFFGGTIWAALALGIDWGELHFRELSFCLLLLAPSLWLNAVELQLCARAAGGHIDLSPALSASSWATIANLLPLPAGALIRAAALTRGGASLAKSGTVLVLAALLWLGIAAAVTALAVSRSTPSIVLSVVALLALVPITGGIARFGGAGVAAGFLVVRTGLLGLAIGRIYFCFMTLGYPASIHESSAYASASVIGAIAGIAPAGAGIAEGIGAVLATLMERSAAAAFLALSMNRLAGLSGAALLSAYFMVRRTPNEIPRKAQ